MNVFKTFIDCMITNDKKHNIALIRHTGNTVSIMKDSIGLFFWSFWKFLNYAYNGMHDCSQIDTILNEFRDFTQFVVKKACLAVLREKLFILTKIE